MNCSSNLSEVPFNQSASNPSREAYLAYNGVLLVILLLPAIVLNFVIVLGFLKQKKLPRSVRIVLCCISISGIMNATGLVMQRLGGIILTVSPVTCPNLPVCRFIIWVILGGAVARLSFMAVFAVTTLRLVVSLKGGVKTASCASVVLACTVWLACLLYGSGLFFSKIGNVHYTGGVSCALLAVGLPTSLYFVFFVIIFGLFPVGVAVVTPVITLCYIKHHSAINDIQIKKAMARFTLFLLIGNFINLAALIVPIAIASQRTEENNAQGQFLDYLPYALMVFSLFPPPVLMLLFFKQLRRSVGRLLTCCCPRGAVGFRSSSPKYNGNGIRTSSSFRRISLRNKV